jgi:hypothetical protein
LADQAIYTDAIGIPVKAKAEMEWNDYIAHAIGFNVKDLAEQGLLCAAGLKN